MVEYFADYRQAQINELAESIRQISIENNAANQSLDQMDARNQFRRNILKKLLHFMTIGLDLSKLFPHVVMISATSDPVQKKIIYQYLTEYADANKDLAMLVVNALQKDSKDSDPSIRSLAIRSLSTLKTIDYSLPIVRDALLDTSFLVQNAAIIASMRLVMQNSDLSIRTFSKYLNKSLHSPNPYVIANSFFAIAHIQQLKGFPVQLSRTSTLHLINTLKSFSEWNQIILLSLISSFKPGSEDELFNILNELDCLISSNSPALVLGCSKCFLMWTIDYPNLYSHIIKRVSKPLITLASTCFPESSYIIYENLLQIISNASDENKVLFQDSFVSFFLKHNDTFGIKYLKLQILSEILCQGNFEFIFEHIQFYLNDHTISEYIFSILVKIGVLYSDVLDNLLDNLKICLEFENKSIVNMAIESIKYLIIHYPLHATQIIMDIFDIKHCLSSFTAMSSYISLLGEFGKDVDASPYIISEYIELCTPGNKSEEGFTKFLEELLTACVKLFITRSPEIVDSLTKLIKFIVEENICPHLIDRCTLYYRLLHCEDIQTLNELLFGAKVIDTKLSKYKSQNWINNFNILYNATHVHDKSKSNIDVNDHLINVSFVDSVYDIFNPCKIPNIIKLKSITPAEFEDMWFNLDGPRGLSVTLSRPLANAICTISQPIIEKSAIDAVLTDMKIEIIASGELESELKYFLFCSDELEVDYYIQLIVDQKIDIMCKTSISTEREYIENLLNIIYDKVTGLSQQL